MFDKFSERARRVVFLARATAGRRGSGAIEIDDLAVAIIVEDQNAFARVLGMPEGTLFPTSNFHRARAFFSADEANELLARIEPLLGRGEPIADSADMPLSASAGKLFEAVLSYSRVEPLHLLLAVLEENTNASAAIFRSAGITPDRVRTAIDSGEYF